MGMASRHARRRGSAAALAGILALLLAGCASQRREAPPSSGGATAGRQPPPRLLGGGPAAFRRQLAALRGKPVVVNQWASWCGPCRYEFPFFQRLSAIYRGRVAFLGVDAQDSREAAAAFLRELPTPYPHFFDPTLAISREFKGGFAWPTTAFYDARGRLTRTHPGVYASQARLAADIRTYALHG